MEYEFSSLNEFLSKISCTLRPLRGYWYCMRAPQSQEGRISIKALDQTWSNTYKATSVANYLAAKQDSIVV